MKYFKKIKGKTIGLVSTVLLTTFGLGANCPGSATNNKATFKSSSFASAISSVFQKSWTSPYLVDFGASDLTSDTLRSYNNVNAGSVAADFPSLVLSDGSGSFHTFFSRLNSAATKSNLFETYNSAISTQNWTRTLSDITELDYSTLTYSRRPLGVVDSSGNIDLTFVANNGVTDRLYGMRRISDSGSWISSQDITDTAVAFSVEENSVAVGVDAVQSEVAAWVQNSHFYFNEYRASTGWRFSAINPFVTIEQAGNVVLQQGADVGFDSYGNGYGFYVDSSVANTIIGVRWRGDTPARFSTTPADYRVIDTGATIYGYPKAAVMPDGSAFVFYYNNFDTVDSSELWLNSTPANSSSNPGNFVGGARFDTASGVGTVYMVSGTTVLPPIVKVAGNYAALGFIKSDGTARRLYLYRYYNGAWTSFGSVSDALLGFDVNWADVAINTSGDMAVTWSLTNTVNEFVLANVYRNGGWTGSVQLNRSALANSSVYGLISTTDKTRPSIAIDSSGNVVATFTAEDSGYLTTNRRAVISEYK